MGTKSWKLSIPATRDPVVDLGRPPVPPVPRPERVGRGTQRSEGETAPNHQKLATPRSNGGSSTLQEAAEHSSEADPEGSEKDRRLGVGDRNLSERLRQQCPRRVGCTWSAATHRSGGAAWWLRRWERPRPSTTATATATANGKRQTANRPSYGRSLRRC